MTHISQLFSFLFYSSAEGAKRKSRKLKALLTEGNADDGNAPQNSRQYKSNGQLPAAKDDPNNVGNGVLGKIGVDPCSKWPKAYPCQLEALNSEGNADDGDTPHKPKKQPCDRRKKSRKNQPKNITDQFHPVKSPFYLIPLL